MGKARQVKRTRGARKAGRARDARARQRGLPRAPRHGEAGLASETGAVAEGHGSVSPLPDAEPEPSRNRRSLPVGIKLLAVALLVIAALWLVAGFRR